MKEFTGKVLRVVDADTVDCIVDLGFDVSIRRRCRLHGIDAPELRSSDPGLRAQGIEAKLQVEKLLSDSKGRVNFIYHGDGKFGRPLMEVIIGELNLNKFLVENGYAKEYFGGKR